MVFFLSKTNLPEHTTEDTADGLSALPSELGEEEEEKETSNDPFILQLQLKCCIKVCNFKALEDLNNNIMKASHKNSFNFVRTQTLDHLLTDCS